MNIRFKFFGQIVEEVFVEHRWSVFVCYLPRYYSAVFQAHVAEDEILARETLRRTWTPASLVRALFVTDESFFDC